MTEDEERLAGGNLSTVVRVGDTVRRPAGPWTEAVQALLRHLARAGFDAAPRALGRDPQDREILTFIPGETAGDTRPWPSWVWTHDTLVATARLLRRYHEAVRDFEQPPGTRWRLTEATARPGEVICHNDCAPYNLVRRAGGELALIDWDVAGPGAPAYDVAFAACAFAPMHDDEACRRLGLSAPPDRAARLRTLLDAYGLEQRKGFVALMAERLQASIDRITAGAEAGDPAFRGLIDRGLLEPVRASRALIARRQDELQAAIMR